MARSASRAWLHWLLLLIAALGGPAAAEPEPDLEGKTAAPAPRALKLTVEQRELEAPVKEFRDLARQIAAGSTDKRVLRAYNRLYPRLFPFDHVPPRDLLVRALAAKQRLERSQGEALGPLADGCWDSIGPYNIPGRMTDIALHPSDPETVFTTGADGGVWKTADLGETWTPLGDFEATLAMGALAIDPVDPDVIYAGTGEANYAGDNLAGLGMMKSTDGGISWTLSAPFASAFHQIVLDPRERATIWAATRQGLFVSRDSGGSWTPAGGGLPAEDTTDVLISAGDPDIMFAGVGSGFDEVSGRGLWRSSDGGASWARLTTFPADGNVGRIKIAQCASVPTRLYAAVHRTDMGRSLTVQRSDDHGLTWTAVTMPVTTSSGTYCDAGATVPCDVADDCIGMPGDGTCVSRPVGNVCSTFCWYCLTIGADPVDPDTAYLGGINIFRTTDAGASWSRVNSVGSGSYVHVDQHAFITPAGGVFWSANDGGINLSRDHGTTWDYVGEKLATAQYYHLTTDPTDDGFATGGTQDQNSHRFTGSADWEAILGGDGAFSAIDWEDPNIWYASTQFLGLHRSRDRGGSMTRIGTEMDADPAAFIAPYILDRSNPKTIYAGTNRLWRSTDEGDSFTPVSPDLSPGGGTVRAIDNCRDVPESIWVGTSSGRLWHSPDGGGVWDDRSAGLPGRSITSIAAHPLLPDTAYVTVGGTGVGRIWATDDAGLSWRDLSGTLPDIHFNMVLLTPDSPDTLIVAADLGVYRSDDAGLSWRVYGENLPNVAVDWLSYSELTHTIRAGTHGRGAWQLVPKDSCALAPSFAGIRAILLADSGGACVPELNWDPAEGECAGAPGVSYNVYRTSDVFSIPTGADLLASGIPGTSYVDTTAVPGATYNYRVRAEDGQTAFDGPANGGMQDSNLAVLRIQAADPLAGGTLVDDGGDSAAALQGLEWSPSDAFNTTPGGSLSNHSARLGSDRHAGNVCGALTTPSMLLGPGARLSYQASFNLEHQWDGVVVEITTDGGETWIDLPPDGGYPETLALTRGNGCGFPATREVFSGPAGNAAPTPFSVYGNDLAAYVGETVRIRWLLTTDGGVEFEGMFLDDVSVTGVGAPSAPALGNVLRAVKEAGRPRFLWTDVAGADGYRLYHATDKPFVATRAPAGAGPSGAEGIVDTVARPEPAHYYRLHTTVGCGEGP